MRGRARISEPAAGRDCIGRRPRRLLAQRFMSTVLVIVGQVFVCKPFQMSLIQRDYVIRHLPAQTSNPALRDSVLPWTPDACANGFNAARLQELDDITAELGVPVQYNVALGTGQGERLSQLLYDPLARRVRRGVEVQNTAAAVLNHKQAIEHAKSQRGNSKEIKRRDHLAMVVQEGLSVIKISSRRFLGVDKNEFRHPVRSLDT